jgi:hypothetical protein
MLVNDDLSSLLLRVCIHNTLFSLYLTMDPQSYSACSFQALQAFLMCA